MIATCVVTYNRLAYTQRCITSLLATARLGDRLVVVDNGSTDGTVEWFRSLQVPLIENAENLWPGAACNQGWDFLSPADYLHRSDNDIEYLPGWQDEVERALADSGIGLVGILNLHEDHGEPDPPEGVDIVPNVGGNVVIRGSDYPRLRWDEKPWDVGSAEDGVMSERAGTVARLRKTVANNMAFGRYADFPDYYDETARRRGIPDARYSV